MATSLGLSWLASAEGSLEPCNSPFPSLPSPTLTKSPRGTANVANWKDRDGMVFLRSHGGTLLLVSAPFLIGATWKNLAS